MPNLNSVGTPDVNKRVASEQVSRTEPKRKTASSSLRGRQGMVPEQYATGGRPQVQRQPQYQPAQQAQPQVNTGSYPQPSPDRTQAGWATGANTGMRPGRPDLGQTTLAPPVRQPMPVQGGFTGGRPVMPQVMPMQTPVQSMSYAGGNPQMGQTPNRAPQYAQSPMQAQPQPMNQGYQPQQAFANQYNPQQARQGWKPQQPFANQYNPNQNWRR